MKLLSAAVLAAFPAIATSATAPVTSSSRVDTLVVTASRQSARVTESLADVTVLERDEIEQAGVSSLPELLSRQPGISSYSNGGAGKVSGLFVRGNSPSQTLVLVDGLRFGSATAGGAALEHLPLDQIERIEIVRGPASALYGADAVGGVIQIFTRKGRGAPQLDAFAGAGRYGTESYALGGSGEAGALRFSLRGSYDKTDGFSATTDPVKQPYSYDPDKDGYRRNAVSGSLGWKIAEGHQLDLSAQYTEGRSWYDAQDSMTGRGYDAYSDATVSIVGATLRDRLLPDWDSTLQLGSTTDDSRDHAPWSPAGAQFRTQQNQVGWQNDVRSGFGTWLLGTDWVRQTGLSEGNFDVARTIAGYFAGWNAEYAGHRLQANLRHDDNSQFGAHNTGTLAWGWQFIPQWKVRASFGTSFRAPSFNDLYYPGYGNPELKAERGRNGEVALAWSESSNRLSLTAYRSRVRELINSVCDASWVCRAENVAHAELDGVTLVGATEWRGVSVEASADWLHAHDPDTDTRLARRPDRQVSLVTGYGAENWRAGAEFKGVSGRYDDAANTKRLAGYGLLNLFGHLKLSRQIQLEARVDNLNGAKYETARGYGVAGTSVFAGVRVTTR